MVIRGVFYNSKHLVLQLNSQWVTFSVETYNFGYPSARQSPIANRQSHIHHRTEHEVTRVGLRFQLIPIIEFPFGSE